jgi:hypothetical protein
MRRHWSQNYSFRPIASSAAKMRSREKKPPFLESAGFYKLWAID